MLPAVSDMKIDSFWAGLRPQTFDQKPFIGHHPEEEGDFICNRTLSKWDFACSRNRTNDP